MKKTTHEIGLMFNETNTNNIENFKNIIPFFRYSDDSNKRIIQLMENRQENTDIVLGDELFKLDNQQRTWLEIQVTAETDETFHYFLDNIEKCGLHILCNDVYQAFKTGKLPDGQKFFKKLLKEGFIRQETIDNINARKTKDQKLYVCVSRNPIDYLMSSTNQSFSSCLNLESEYSRSYYMGLPSMLLDPNRAIIFITNGKLSTYTKGTFSIKHFKYIQRSWLLINQDLTYSIQGFYPNEKIKIQEYIEKEFKLKECEKEKNFLSFFEFKPAEFLDSIKAMIFLDTEIKFDEKTSLYVYNENLPQTMTQFDNYKTFWEKQSSNYYNLVMNKNKCCLCNKEMYMSYLREHISFPDEIHDYICHECSQLPKFKICDHCEMYHHEQHSRNINERIVCDSCLTYYKYCAKCNKYEYRHGDNFCDNDGNTGFICYNCINNLNMVSSCRRCGIYFMRDESSPVHYCERCRRD